MKQKILIILFLLTIGTPYLVWPVARNYVDSENYEKRELAALPTFETNTIEDFPMAMENYINDHLPFRNQMIRVYNVIQYYAFHTPTNNRVLIGKDDWLFYNDSSDGDPIGHYRGKTLFSEEELEKIAENMIVTRDNLAKEGCEFVIFAAPNKERIYAEYMPNIYGKPAEQYALLQVVEYLKKNTDIRIVYPYEELIKAKETLNDMLLYHKTDTHWNELGAYIGTTELLKELNIELPLITSNEINIAKSNNTPGDLAKMLNLGNLIDAGSKYEITGYGISSMKTLKNEFFGEKIYHTAGADPRKIFMLRDSFGSSLMAKLIGSQFENSYLLHSNAYTGSEIVREQKPDIFIYEFVERYIENLLSFVYK